MSLAKSPIRTGAVARLSKNVNASAKLYNVSVLTPSNMKGNTQGWPFAGPPMVMQSTAVRDELINLWL